MKSTETVFQVTDKVILSHQNAGCNVSSNGNVLGNDTDSNDEDDDGHYEQVNFTNTGCDASLKVISQKNPTNSTHITGQQPPTTNSLTRYEKNGDIYTAVNKGVRLPSEEALSDTCYEDINNQHLDPQNHPPGNSRTSFFHQIFAYCHTVLSACLSARQTEEPKANTSSRASSMPDLLDNLIPQKNWNARYKENETTKRGSVSSTDGNSLKDDEGIYDNIESASHSAASANITNTPSSDRWNLTFFKKLLGIGATGSGTSYTDKGDKNSYKEINTTKETSRRVSSTDGNFLENNTSSTDDIGVTHRCNNHGTLPLLHSLFCNNISPPDPRSCNNIGPPNSRSCNNIGPPGFKACTCVTAL